MIQHDIYFYTTLSELSTFLNNERFSEKQAQIIFPYLVSDRKPLLLFLKTEIINIEKASQVAIDGKYIRKQKKMA